MPKNTKIIEKPKNFKGTTKKLIKNYLSKHKLSILAVFFFSSGSTIFAVIGPKILGNATTEIFNGIVNKISGIGSINFEEIARILLTLLILYVASALLFLLEGLTMTNVSQKVTYRLRNDLSKKINRLPMKYFDKRSKGEILSIITNDIDTLSQNLNQSITQMIASVCTVVGILIMMFSISVTMTIASLLILPITAIIVKIIVGKSQKHFKSQQDNLGHVNGKIEEVYGRT